MCGPPTRRDEIAQISRVDNANISVILKRNNDLRKINFLSPGALGGEGELSGISFQEVETASDLSLKGIEPLDIRNFQSIAFLRGMLLAVHKNDFGAGNRLFHTGE
jgi:hypothetical protein